MNVTDEMVERGRRFYYAATGGWYPADIMRSILEAAMADVPEPGTSGLSGPEALRLRIGFERTLRRAEAAEAKLAAVLAWAVDYYGGIHELPDGLDSALAGRP